MFLDNVVFTNSSGNRSSWKNAVANNKAHAYMAYYDSSPSQASQRKYKYAATSDLGMDDSSLRKGKGYWVYANQSGNLTLSSAGGSLAGQTYAWNKLRFRNSSGSELNITQAQTAGWVNNGDSIQYWDTATDGFKYVCSSLLDSQDCGSTSFSSLRGYFIKSATDNITVERQN